MTYTRIGPFIDASPTGPWLQASTINRFEDGLTASNAHLIAGPGIDPTGVTPSTTAVQALLDGLSDGSIATVPNGAIINLDNGLTINKRIRLTGPGELRWTAATTRLLQVNVDGVHLDGLYLTNPNGIQQRGVYVQANIFRATGCRIVGMQDGILIAATGEFHDFVIANNHILDVIGSGLGSGDTTSAGESNGDGIVVWGASATITGNRITCKAGKDARIGIHMEGQPSQELDTTYAHRDALGAITGNVVTGQFRRGIVSEGVAHVTITGNVVADSTWWGIALIGLASHCIVAGNTIKYTRTAADTQGANAAPNRAGIMLFCIQTPLVNTVVADNVIRAVSTSSMPSGIYLQADSSVSSNAATGLQISGNIINDEAAVMGTGINIKAAATDVRIVNNYVGTFKTNGIYAFTCPQIEVLGNKVNGPGIGASIRGVFLDGGAAEARVDGNTIRDVGVGIGAQFRSLMTTANNNWVKNATTGIDLFSSSGIAVVSLNTFSNVTTHTANLPAGTTAVNNN